MLPCQRIYVYGRKLNWKIILQGCKGNLWSYLKKHDLSMLNPTSIWGHECFNSHLPAVCLKLWRNKLVVQQRGVLAPQRQELCVLWRDRTSSTQSTHSLSVSWSREDAEMRQSFPVLRDVSQVVKQLQAAVGNKQCTHLPLMSEVSLLVLVQGM